MIQIFSALATVLVVIIFTVLMSKHFSHKLVAATVLCSIAFIYVGFSLKGNTVGMIVLEVFIAIAFYLIAVIGYSKNYYLITYGIILHGVWDILHHKAFFVKTHIPDYWPLYCLVVDFLLGVYFLLIFRLKKNS